MKEYVCKQESLKRISLLNANLYTVGKVIASIQTQPTVTKIDICRDFAIRISYLVVNENKSLSDAIGIVLEEMEKENA